MKTAIIEQTTLHSNAGTSDKLYWASIERAKGGYVVNFSYGARTGTMTPGCKTVDRKDKRILRPVPLEDAEQVYAGLLNEKRHGKSAYHDYPACGHGGEGASAPSYSTPQASVTTESRNVACQLLTSIEDGKQAADILLSPQYAAQQKFDGKHILLDVTRSTVTGYNRSGLACGISSEIIKAASELAETVGPFMLDGEAIGNRYHAFDLLEVAGVDLRPARFDARDKQLAQLLSVAAETSITQAITAYEEPEKVGLLQQMIDRGLEGVVLKRIDSPYLPGRQRDQFKHKLVKSASFVVMKLNDRNSVQIGTFDVKGNLVNHGSVTIRNATFKAALRPGSIVEVRYLHAFKESGHVYQPRMLAIRDDIRPEECSISQLQYKGVGI